MFKSMNFASLKSKGHNGPTSGLQYASEFGKTVLLANLYTGSISLQFVQLSAPHNLVTNHSIQVQWESQKFSTKPGSHEFREWLGFGLSAAEERVVKYIVAGEPTKPMNQEKKCRGNTEPRAVAKGTHKTT